MTCLSLRAWRWHHRPLYLAELLLALGWSVADMVWTCRDVELPPGAEPATLEELSDSGGELTTLELFRASTPEIQVIDGEFAGRRADSETTEPAIVLRAIRSTSWDLELSSPRDVDTIQAIFPRAEAIEGGT